MNKGDYPKKRIAFSHIDLIAALQFLLITPAFIKRSFSEDEQGRSVGFFPFAGFVLGLFLASSDWLLGFISPNLVRTALILSLWICLTGALHLDGFLDACDGLLGGGNPEKRLQIMRDERIGAFAFSGGILLILLKYSALLSIEDRFTVLFLAPVIGRWTMSISMIIFPYARLEGLGRTMKDHAGGQQAIISTILTLLIIFGMAYSEKSLAIVAALGSAAASYLVARFALVRIPGLTGDIYGAICEISEVSALLIFTFFYH